MTTRSNSSDHVRGEILFQLNDNQSLKNFEASFYKKWIGYFFDTIKPVSENFRIYALRFDPKDVDETFDAGANLYVQKPFSFRSLIILLKKIFMLKWAGVLFKPFRKTFFLSEKNISEGDVQ